ncbi:uncharacterized protein LOC121521038 isoform X2 [Cheilinus undulatus]|uniref:uncharacterized protein LOC121521038 isoform X2 n=1 Tax=Cheilinus undulatus TaxID=241271 RepID=UPI001BD22D1E|nr:uncharacterized protein LOC121521038 isoform X2 [Cheilinus undulatus]
MKPKSLPSRLFDMNSAAAETLNVRATKYQRHVDCVDHGDSQPVEEERTRHEKCHREIHFAFLPERYEVLVDDEALAKQKEEKKKRKKEKYKKVRKHFGMLERQCVPPGSV